MAEISKNYTCGKCGGKHHETGTVKVSGSGIMAILDMEDRTFTSVTCQRCRHTDLYAVEESTLLEMVGDAVFS